MKRTLMSYIPKKCAHMVESFHSERDTDNGLWLYLDYDYIDPDMGISLIHEDTIQQCIARLRRCVARDKE
jgi:hypothetical protein